VVVIRLRLLTQLEQATNFRAFARPDLGSVLVIEGTGHGIAEADVVVSRQAPSKLLDL